MKLEKKCGQCGTVMRFTEKDIKRLTKKEQRALQERNKPFEKILEEKETVGFFRKREVPKYKLSFHLIRAFITEAYGHIICPVCKLDQLLVKEDR